ncbi:MAG: glycosyl transferase [Microbacterium sp.]|nr:glycosyl transferase [Microbacterium sp.]MBA4346866.1 glycosyl transferase [Microbacterium sp.]
MTTDVTSIDPAPPIVDLVIAIHDARRPLAAAIASLRHQGLSLGTQLRVTVVCHNIPIDEIEALLSASDRDAVRLMSCNDGIPSPAGPFTAGLAAATGRYVSVMGSDDSLEPGALAAWVARAERYSFAAVIAPVRLPNGAIVRTPPRRPGRRAALDPVKDRLAYRTAPLGLVRRDVVTRLGLSFTPGVTTGEDHEFSLPLWFSGEPVGYAAGDPAYRVGSGVAPRVTETPRPADELVRAIELLIDQRWVRALPASSRHAIVVKLLRVHVFALAARSSIGAGWLTGEREHVAALVRDLIALAPTATDVLAIADRDLLDALLDVSTDSAELVRLAHRRRRFGTPATMLTRSPRHLLAREAPVRFMVASALV